MADLVERLREPSTAARSHFICRALQAEAADEIERLRAELEKERAACAAWWSAYEKHRAENARLRATLRIIAGQEQCIDNLMSNVDVAREALAKESGS